MAASAVDMQRTKVRRIVIFREIHQVFLSCVDLSRIPVSAVCTATTDYDFDALLVIYRATLGSLHARRLPYLSPFDLSDYQMIEMSAGLTADMMPLGIQLVGL